MLQLCFRVQSPCRIFFALPPSKIYTGGQAPPARSTRTEGEAPMKRRRNKELRNARALRLWTYDEATKALPYLRLVVGSLREHWLDAQMERRKGELLAARPGRPDRQRLLAGAALHANQEG